MSFVAHRLRDTSLRLRLKLAYARVLGLKRGGYKSVWEKVSSSEDTAMIGVAGIADPADFTRSGESTAQSLTTMLAITPEHEVLEIGCGVGRIGQFLAPQCHRWIGCDISGNMISHARKRLSGLTNVELIELSSSSLREIPDCSVDRVYCSAVFMHLDEWDRFGYVTEAFRVLRPSGMCYFDNINLAGQHGWDIFMQMCKHDELLRPPHISKTSTEEELRIYLDRAHFTQLNAFPGSHWIAITGVRP